MYKLIIFNWKMNPSSLKEAMNLLNLVPKQTKNGEIVIAPPFVYLEKLAVSAVAQGYGGLRFASQNCFWENQGAFTGEISPQMLKNLGVEYVIIGHSERRYYMRETDEMINKKVLAALKAGLKVILCVGENLKIRKKDKKAVESFISNQLQKYLKNSKSLILNSKLGNHLVIAYEPVWAISTSGAGSYCKPADALEIIKFIKQTLNSKFYILNSRVLYGGSVNSKNIKDFVKYKEIDGALVGSASLNKKEVKEIIKLCQKKI